MNGAVELHKACAKHGVKPIFGCEIYLVDDHTRAPARRKIERNHLTLLAAERRRLPQPRQALLGRLSGGPAAAASRPSTSSQIEQHAEGVIALTGCLASRFCQRLLEDRPEDARAHADDLLRIFGPENVYFEVQKNGLARAGEVQRGDRADRPRARRQPRGHRRRPLPAPRGLRPPHRAAVRADQEHARRAEADLRDQRVLPARQRRDGRRLRASGPRRSPARSRSPSAARSSSSSASS